MPMLAFNEFRDFDGCSWGWIGWGGWTQFGFDNADRLQCFDCLFGGGQLLLPTPSWHWQYHANQNPPELVYKSVHVSVLCLNETVLKKLGFDFENIKTFSNSLIVFFYFSAQIILVAGIKHARDHPALCTWVAISLHYLALDWTILIKKVPFWVLIPVFFPACFLSVLLSCMPEFLEKSKYFFNTWKNLKIQIFNKTRPEVAWMCIEGLHLYISLVKVFTQWFTQKKKRDKIIKQLKNIQFTKKQQQSLYLFWNMLFYLVN